MSKWTKVTTPPDSNRTVLIAPAKRSPVGIGRYERSSGGGYWVDEQEAGYDEGSGCSLIHGVRYWMPLPKPPAGTPQYDDTEYEAIGCG